MKKIYLKNSVNNNDFYKGILSNFERRNYGEVFDKIKGDDELQWCLSTGDLKNFETVVKQRIEDSLGRSPGLLDTTRLIK